MSLPNRPERPLELGIIKEQTRLITTKTLHDSKEPTVIPMWLFGLLFIVVVLICILGVYALTQSSIFLTKPERIAMDNFKNSPETRESRVDSYGNMKMLDRELIWNLCVDGINGGGNDEFSEEFKAAYTLSDIERLDGFGITWFSVDEIPHNWFYYMARIDGEWVIAGIIKDMN